MSTVLLTLKIWLQKPIGATAECQILKQFYIINLLSFISIIIYTISPSITNSLGTVVVQPLLHLTVPHGSRSSIAEPIIHRYFTAFEVYSGIQSSWDYNVGFRSRP